MRNISITAIAALALAGCDPETPVAGPLENCMARGFSFTKCWHGTAESNSENEAETGGETEGGGGDSGGGDSGGGDSGGGDGGECK